MRIINASYLLGSIAGLALLSAGAARLAGGCIDDPCKVPSLAYPFESSPSHHHRHDDASGTFCAPCYGYRPNCWREWPDCCVQCPPPPARTVSPLGLDSPALAPSHLAAPLPPAVPDVVSPPVAPPSLPAPPAEPQATPTTPRGTLPLPKPEAQPPRKAEAPMPPRPSVTARLPLAPMPPQLGRKLPVAAPASTPSASDGGPVGVPTSLPNSGPKILPDVGAAPRAPRPATAVRVARYQLPQPLPRVLADLGVAPMPPMTRWEMEIKSARLAQAVPSAEGETRRIAYQSAPIYMADLPLAPLPPR